MPLDPIVGGTVLRIPAIQSPNFSLANMTGWAIFQDGTAYFFGATVGGQNFIINGSGAFFYVPSAGFGNLIGSDAATAGTDQYGNAYLAGTTNYTQVGGVFFAQQSTIGIQFFTAASAAGPWVQTEFAITPDGTFWYSGTPATGNLVFAIAAQAGVDDFGNAYVSGPAFYVYQGAAPVVTTITATGTGNFSVPASITQLTVQTWSPGAGGAGGGLAGGANSGGLGGGGGGYASAVLSVTPLSSLPYLNSAGGAGGAVNGLGHDAAGDTEFNANAVGAHGGKAATISSVGLGGVPFAGTVQFTGGNGGHATGQGGSGGGSSAGTSSGGNNAPNNSGSGPGAGGTAVSGGGAGGAGGGNAAPNGVAGSTPGGGGGGGEGGAGAGTGAAGANGKIVVTYIPSGATLVAVPVQLSAGGNVTFTGTDTNVYQTGRKTVAIAGQTISSTSPTALASFPVTAGQYLWRGWLIYHGTASTATFTYTGPTTSLIVNEAIFILGGTVTSSFNVSFASMTSQTLSGTTQRIMVEGIVTFTAAGTFAFKCQETTNLDTVVISGGWFELLPNS